MITPLWIGIQQSVVRTILRRLAPVAALKTSTILTAFHLGYLEACVVSRLSRDDIANRAIMMRKSGPGKASLIAYRRVHQQVRGSGEDKQIRLHNHLSELNCVRMRLVLSHTRAAVSCELHLRAGQSHRDCNLKSRSAIHHIWLTENLVLLTGSPPHSVGELIGCLLYSTTLDLETESAW